jgi:hypothetical protein
MWSVTFSHRGNRRVERVPTEWVAELEQAVLETRTLLDGIKEVMAINIELLALTRTQQQAQKVRRAAKKRQERRQPRKNRSTLCVRDRSSNM